MLLTSWKQNEENLCFHVKDENRNFNTKTLDNIIFSYLCHRNCVKQKQ